MLLHHVEGNSLVPCRIDPKKLKWGLENCMWGILHERKGSCAQPSELTPSLGLWTTSILPCHYRGSAWDTSSDGNKLACINLPRDPACYCQLNWVNTEDELLLEGRFTSEELICTSSPCAKHWPCLRVNGHMKMIEADPTVQEE